MDLTNFSFLCYFLNNSCLQLFFKFIVILLQEFLIVFKSLVNIKWTLFTKFKMIVY